MNQTVEFIEKSFQNSGKRLEDLGATKTKIGCIIMASGLSVRFGENKLLYEVEGKSLIEKILETTGQDLFAKRVVVTRSEDVEKICREKNVDVILHAYPNRNDTVRLGVEYLQEMDGWVFCPCDQPFLSSETLKKMLDIPYVHEDMMVRVAFGDCSGAPIFFGKKYQKELMGLPEKKGGSYLVKKYPEKVQLLYVQDERELWDIDTREDLRKMNLL